MKTIAIFLVVCVAVVLGKSCKDGSECEADECCLAKGIWVHRSGECTPRGQADESCSFDDDHEVFGKHIIHCPCAAGLSCEPTKIFETPFGTLKYDNKCQSDATGAPEEEITTEEAVEE